MRKQLSIKRLYMLANNYLLPRAKKENWTISGAKAEMDRINDYLRYVLEHKDDEL